MKSKLLMLIVGSLAFTQLAVARDFFSEAQRVAKPGEKPVPLVLLQDENGDAELYRADKVDVKALAEAKAKNDEVKIAELVADVANTGTKLSITDKPDQDKATACWGHHWYGGLSYWDYWGGWNYYGGWYVVWSRPIVVRYVTIVIFW